MIGNMSVSDRWRGVWLQGLSSVELIGATRRDVERVHRALQQRRGCGVYQAVPLELRAAAEGIGHQRHLQVRAAARAGMAGMPSAVIDDLERVRVERPLERLAQLRNDLRIHGGAAAAGAGALRPCSHSTCQVMNAKVRIASPNSLKYTQERSLAPYATARLRAPRSA